MTAYLWIMHPEMREAIGWSSIAYLAGILTVLGILWLCKRLSR